MRLRDRSLVGTIVIVAYLWLYVSSGLLLCFCLGNKIIQTKVGSVANGEFIVIPNRAEDSKSGFPLFKQLEMFLRTQSRFLRVRKEMLVRQDDGTLVFGVFPIFSLEFLSDWIAIRFQHQAFPQCWRLAAVYEFNFDFHGFSIGNSCVYFQHSKPRTLVQSETFNSLVKGLSRKFRLSSNKISDINLLLPVQISDHSVDDDCGSDNYLKCAFENRPRPFWYCLFGFVLYGYGYISAKVGYGNWFSLITFFIGLPMCRLRRFSDSRYC